MGEEKLPSQWTDTCPVSVLLVQAGKATEYHDAIYKLTKHDTLAVHCLTCQTPNFFINSRAQVMLLLEALHETA